MIGSYFHLVIFFEGDGQNEDDENDKTINMSSSSIKSEDSQELDPLKRNNQEKNEVALEENMPGKEDVNYSNFMYWRNTLPSLDLKSSQENNENTGSSTSDQVNAKQSDQQTEKGQENEKNAPVKQNEEEKKVENQDEEEKDDAQITSILSTNPTSSNHQTLTELAQQQHNQQLQQSTLKANYDSMINFRLNDPNSPGQNMFSTSNFLSIYTQNQQHQEQLNSKSLDQLSDELKQVGFFF